MKKLSRPGFLSGKTAVIGLPYFWLLICSLLPFLIVMKISFAEMDIRDPLGTLLTLADGVIDIKIKLSNYISLGQDDLYIITYITRLSLH